MVMNTADYDDRSAGISQRCHGTFLHKSYDVHVCGYGESEWHGTTLGTSGPKKSC